MNKSYNETDEHKLIRDYSRADQAASEVFNITRSAAGKLIKSGLINVRGHDQLKPKTSLSTGQEISLTHPKVSRAQLKDIEIIHQDADLLCINKPSGLLTHHKTPFDQEIAASDLVKDFFPEDRLRPGVVHRLDRETSGCLILCKNKPAMDNLKQQFASREVRKTYVCIINGNFEDNEVKVDIPIARSLSKPYSFTLSSRGRSAQTFFKKLKYNPKLNVSLIEARPITGRTHQIRVHLKALDRSIVGDKLYSKLSSNPTNKRMMLHCLELKLNHPSTQQSLELHADSGSEFDI